MLSLSNRASAKRTENGILVKRRSAFWLDLNKSELELAGVFIPKSKSGTLSPKPFSLVHSFCVPIEKVRYSSGVNRLATLKISDSRLSVICELLNELLMLNDGMP